MVFCPWVMQSRRSKMKQTEIYLIRICHWNQMVLGNLCTAFLLQPRCVISALPSHIFVFFFVVLWIIYYHDCIFLDVKQLSGQIILKGGIRFVKIFFCATHFRFPADRLFSRGLAFFLVGSRESLLAGFIRYLKNSFYFTTGKTPSHNSEAVFWNGYQTLHLL